MERPAIEDATWSGERPRSPCEKAAMARCAAVRISRSRAAARLEEISREPLAVLLDPEHVPHVVRALEVVHRGVHPGGIREGRVVGDVAHPLLADIDRPPVADACEIVFARAQHGGHRPAVSTARMLAPARHGRNRARALRYAAARLLRVRDTFFQPHPEQSPLGPKGRIEGAPAVSAITPFAGGVSSAGREGPWWNWQTQQT